MQLQFYREKVGITQEQLAMQVGLSVAMIQSIENGRRIGSAKTIVKLAHTLGVTTDDLLRADDNTNSNNSRIDVV